MHQTKHRIGHWLRKNIGQRGFVGIFGEHDTKNCRNLQGFKADRFFLSALRPYGKSLSKIGAG